MCLGRCIQRPYRSLVDCSVEKGDSWLLSAIGIYVDYVGLGALFGAAGFVNAWYSFDAREDARELAVVDDF